MFFISFIVYFHSFLAHVLGLRDSERDRERGIDVIDGDNLCKGAPFLLRCNLLHLLHDVLLTFLLLMAI